MSLIEISFSRSREIVSQSINLVLKEIITKKSLEENIKDNKYFLLLVFNFIGIVIFSIGSGLDKNFRSGLIFSIIIILFLIILNWFLLKRYIQVEKQELLYEIKSIVEEYTDLLNKYQHLSSKNDIQPRLINSGHSHVSIVAVFRDGQWHRLPTLLLVEGDIISLMSGDTAPGDIYELIPDNSHNNNNNNINNNNNNSYSTSRSNHLLSSSNDSTSKFKDKHGWRKGQFLQHGTKILLREERKKYASPTELSPNDIPTNFGTTKDNNDNNNNNNNNNNIPEKHKQSRAINSQSIELLTLSGDMRCFLMAETPIIKYCKETLNSNNYSNSNSPRDSYVRTLYYEIFNEGIKASALITILVIIAMVIRILILSEADRQQITLNVLIPFAIVILSFTPISLPIVLIIAESLATANVLATTEALINSQESNESFDSTDDFPKIQKLSDNSFIRNSLGKIYQSITRKKRSKRGSRQSPNERRDQHPDESSDSSNAPDEYQDEDIDDRAEKIADKASLNIPWGRQLTYSIRVFFTRIGLSLPSWKCFELDSKTLLPTPLARTRIIENLGAVTMVCFVDDDIVCEGYSVSEEVYLLNPVDQQPQQLNIEQRALGLVLDLHANPQVTGTRFENPEWWKHLPSLKPIGLASMLTYSSLGEEINSCDDDLLVSLNVHQNHHQQQEQQKFPIRFKIPTSQNVITDQQGIISPQHRQCAEIELVKHVKRTTPFECLRELAGEIGFDNEDIEKYNRILGLSVVAPRLGDIRLMEDTHAWGQEETRRRGNLAPHLTAVVVEDSRKGGLQLMSNGHPPLLLSYCREYWDGTNISPLTSEDRNQLLQVYERWDLEDFDVVAFGYAPVPLALKSHIQSKLSSLTSSTSITTSISRLNTNEKNYLKQSLKGKNKLSTNTLYFVDSSTERQLDCGYRRNGSGGGTVTITNESKININSNSNSNHNNNNNNDVNKTTDSKKDCINLEDSNNYENNNNYHLGNNNIDDEENSNNNYYNENDNDNNDDDNNNIQMSKVMNNNRLFDDSPKLQENEDKEQEVQDDNNNHNHHNINNQSIHLSEIIHAPKPSRTFHFPSNDLQLTPRDDDYSTGYESSHVLQDDSQSEYVSLEIRSEPNLSPPLSRDYYSSDFDSTSSSFESVPPSSLLQNPLRQLFRRPKLFHSFSQQAITKQKTFTNFSRHSSLNHHHHHHNHHHYNHHNIHNIRDLNRVQHRSTSEPSLVQMGVNSHEQQNHLQNIKQAELLCDNHSNSYNSDGYTLIDCSSQQLEQQRHQEHQEQLIPINHQPSQTRINIAETTDSNDISATSDIILSPNLHSLSANNISISPYMKKSLSLDYGLNTINVSSYLPSSISPTENSRIEINSQFSSELISLDSHKVRNQDSTVIHRKSRRIGPINKKNSLSSASKTLSETTWTILRQQVFLGMTASSVPVRGVIPGLVEDLTQAGIRFVYFSPRNMRRSKKLAEKIGLQTDWNCAISLRPLDSPDTHDPHRFISSYADWDVKARLPHGIEAIRKHLKEVDNVPLLVSLFTDSTPSTVKSMIDIFRENGEVVLSIGSAYRSYNQAIYRASDLGIAIDMLPGETNQLSSSSSYVISTFPLYSEHYICQPDLILMFRLVSLHTTHVLQSPTGIGDFNQFHQHNNEQILQSTNDYENILEDVESNSSKNEEQKSTTIKFTPSFDLLRCTGCFRRSSNPDSHQQNSNNNNNNNNNNNSTLNLKGLLEAIRKGRVLLLNVFQILALLSITSLSLSLWSVVSLAIPMTAPPVPPPPLVLLFLCIQLPVLSLAMLFSPGISEVHVMRQTPRKNKLVRRPKDVTRFQSYLVARVVTVIVSVYVVGWFASSSLPLDTDHFIGIPKNTWLNRITSVRDVMEDGVFDKSSLGHFCHVQDVMSIQFLLAIITQSITLMHRGQSITQISSPLSHPEYYFALVFCLSLHTLVLFLRALTREGGLDLYYHMDMQVWIAIGAFPIIGLIVGFFVNSDDVFSYQRHLQFLRLEFDTRLGMHSPR